VSLLDRVRDLLRRTKEPGLRLTGTGFDTPDLVVVAEAFDPIEADSAVLARSRTWADDRPAVLRHHLLLPADQITVASRVLAQEGYVLREPGEGDVREEGTRVLVHASRVQHLDALHCAQERSRMAGLAQRLGGDALGWDALQAPAPG
jgi:hypothetical protein